MSSVFRLTFAFSNSLGLATHDTNGINPTNVDRERDLFARRGRGNDTRNFTEERTKVDPVWGKEEEGGAAIHREMRKAGEWKRYDAETLCPYSSSCLSFLLKWKTREV